MEEASCRVNTDDARLTGLYSSMNLNVYHREDFSEADVSFSEHTDVKSSGSGACIRWMKDIWRNEGIRG